jgi:hypothetical protein
MFPVPFVPRRAEKTLAAIGEGRSIQGGRNRARTCDLFGVSEALSQLSYSPIALHYTWKGAFCQLTRSLFRAMLLGVRGRRRVL